MLKLKDHEFKVRLGYTVVRPCLKKQTKNCRLVIVLSHRQS
jgi:hypothetical protein